MVLVLGLPFLNKPIHIDDPVVLEVSEQILKDPLRPYAGWINWEGYHQSMYATTTNPPFLSYFLAPVLGVFGYNEVALHAAMLVFPLLLAWGMVVLSRRFANGSPWPTLLVLTSPSLMVSLNCMRDVPGEALIVAAVACFVVGCDRDRWGWLILGGVLAGFAILGKYSQITVLLVFALYALLNRKPVKLAALAVPLIIVGIWFAQNVWEHGEIHLSYLARVRHGEKPFTWLDQLRGGTTIFGSLLFLWPAAIAHDIRFKHWGRIVICVLATAACEAEVYYHFYAEETPLIGDYYFWAGSGAWLMVWIACVGISALWKADFRDCGKTLADREGISQRGDAFFLMIWGMSHLVISIFGIFFQAVRHVMPAFPAFALLGIMAFQAEGRGMRVPVRNTLLVAAVAAQFLLTLFINAADYQFGNPPRHFLQENYERLAATGREIWYRGSWGFRTYAEEYGLINIAINSPAPPEGAWVIECAATYKCPYPMGFDTNRLKLVEEHEYKGVIPLRTMVDHASFYAVVYDNLPYRFSHATEDVVQIYQVGPPDRSWQTAPLE